MCQICHKSSTFEGLCFEGCFERGLRALTGKVTLRNGVVYEGEFSRDGRRHGNGRRFLRCGWDLIEIFHMLGRCVKMRVLCLRRNHSRHEALTSGLANARSRHQPAGPLWAVRWLALGLTEILGEKS